VRTVTLRDSDGNDLATALLSLENAGPRLALERVLAGRGTLLRHYFGKGLRAVMLESGDFRLRGKLSTRWAGGERVWFVELQPVVVQSGESDAA
jgi:hypothetical protein